MSLSLNTPPAAEPVTLDDAKAHLKVDTTDDDALITSLISAARARAEWHTGRAFVTQSWTLWLDGWPGIIEIPLPPLQSVASVTAFALDDSATVLDAATYQVDTASSPARLTLKPNASPPVALRRINAIAIAFTAGYGDAGQRCAGAGARGDPEARRQFLRQPRRCGIRHAAGSPRASGALQNIERLT